MSAIIFNLMPPECRFNQRALAMVLPLRRFLLVSRGSCAPRGDFIIICAGFKSPLARFYHNLSRFFRRFPRALPCYELIFASFADYGNIILRSMAFFNRFFRRRGRVFHPHCSENRAPTICDHIKTRRSPISLRRVSNSLKLHPLFARISQCDSSIATVFPIVRPTFRLTLCFAIDGF